MKKFITRIAVAATLIAAQAASAGAVEFSFGHVLAEGTWYHDVAVKFKKSVEEKSNREITVNIFPSAQLGGEVKMLQNAIAGAPIVVITSISPIENFIPEVGVFSLPYVFDSIEQANEVLQGEIGSKYLAMMPEHGLVGLGYLTAAERNVFGTKAVRKLSDMNGMKIRVVQAPGYVKAYEGFGAQPTPMAYSEQYLALQNKVVDAAEAAPEVLIIDKLAEVSTHYNLTRSHYMPLVISVSGKSYDALSDAQKKAMKEAAAEATAMSQKAYKKLYDDSIAALPGLGVEVVETDLTEFRARAAELHKSMLAGVPGGEALLAELLAAKK